MPKQSRGPRSDNKGSNHENYRQDETWRESLNELNSKRRFDYGFNLINFDPQPKPERVNDKPTEPRKASRFEQRNF